MTSTRATRSATPSGDPTPRSPAATHRDAASTLGSGDLLIGERRIRDGAGGRADHVSPTTGEPQATFAIAGPTDVDEAVTTARAALTTWGALLPSERRQTLLALADLVERDGPRFAPMTALESGTPVAIGSAGRLTVEYLRYFAGWADKLEGATIPVWPQPGLDYTCLEPVGVVGVLIPWNGPLTSIGQKVAPALAAGCTVVLKPSELAPFVALRFGELCLEAGIPPGVVNVIPGDAATGEHLVAHPGIDKLSFTGSPETGRRVMAAAAANLTPVLLELGGKSALVVFDDADLDAAVGTAVRLGVVTGSGQGCVLPTRLLVQSDVYDEVLERVQTAVEAVVVGDPLEPSTQMGPVIGEAACERILGVVERARADGARVVTGGARVGGGLAAGSFVAPTVFADVDPASDLAQREVFGPVLAVLRFTDEADAIAIANGTTYGLGAFVFTRDVERAHRVAAAFEAGYVGVNGFPMLPAAAPFGGITRSGFGREGGRSGIDEFLRVKNVFVSMPGG
jgi:aldehyde dehydrogenase (NAD+)